MLVPSLRITDEELSMRHGLRRLNPMVFKQVLDCAKPPPPPRLLMVAPHQLVVNEEYQRDLSNQSRARIRHIAENWDWGKYKAISIVRCDEGVCEDAGCELYEVIDGQHAGIAAATNGNIELLPAVLWETGSEISLSEKADKFIGINKMRIALTPAAIFKAELAHGNEEAIAVQCALSFARVELLDSPSPTGEYGVGQVLSLATLRSIYRKHGEKFLTRVLKICRASECAPISSTLLKALENTLDTDDEPEHIDVRIAEYIKGQGLPKLELIAKSQTEIRGRVYVQLARILQEKLNITPRPKKAPGRPKKG